MADIPTPFEHLSSDRQALYIKTRNPLHVWREIEDCCLNEIGLPDWVLKYLQEVAFAFRCIEKPSGNYNREILTALKISDTSIFTDQDNEAFDLKFEVYKDYIQSRYTKYKGERGDSYIADLADALNVTQKTVYNWINDVKIFIKNFDTKLSPVIKIEIINDITELKLHRLSKKQIIYRVYYKSLCYDYVYPFSEQVIEECYEEVIVDSLKM